MTAMRTPLSIVVGLLALFLWRSGKFGKNVLLTSIQLPSAYYIGGDFDTHCQTVKDPKNDMKFCEDAVFWDIHSSSSTKRLVLLSCDPGRHFWNTVMGPLANPDPHGALWLYDPDGKGQPQRLELQGYPPGHDFHPLGIEVSHSHNGAPSTIFVINHARERTVVEQLSIAPSSTGKFKAIWVRTLTSPYFHSANALALTGPSSFYVTNDHAATRRLPTPFGNILPITESVFAVPGGFVAHVSVDEESGAVSSSLSALGVPFANGIKISPSNNKVAVASSSTGNIYMYNRDPATNVLQYNHSVFLPFAPDNLAYDDTGALHVAGHPNFIQLIQVAKDLSDTSVAPSWAVRIKEGESGERDAAPVAIQDKAASPKGYTVDTTFQSDGTKFRSSSTSMYDPPSGKLFVVGVYEQGLLVCGA